MSGRLHCKAVTLLLEVVDCLQSLVGGLESTAVESFLFELYSMHRGTYRSYCYICPVFFISFDTESSLNLCYVVQIVFCQRPLPALLAQLLS